MSMTRFILRFVRSDADAVVDRREDVKSAIGVLGDDIEILGASRRALTIACADDQIPHLAQLVDGLAYLDPYESLKPL
jgi:hypothetical protein